MRRVCRSLRPGRHVGLAVLLALAMGTLSCRTPGAFGASELRSEQGAVGAQQAEVAQAPVHLIRGRALRIDTAVPPGTPVSLIHVDDRGDVLDTLGHALIGDDGEFEIPVRGGVTPSSHAWVRVMDDAGELEAPLTTGAGLVVDPASTALVQLMVWTTETGSRSLSEFTGPALTELLADARAALARSTFRLYDQGAVQRHVLKSIGGRLAASVGGALSVEEGGFFSKRVAPEPASPDLANVSSNGFVFDIRNDCAMSDGYGFEGGYANTYAPMFRLQVDGIDFDAAEDDEVKLQDGQWACGPKAMAGLQVSRKFYVGSLGPFARFTEILVNERDSPVHATVRVFGRLGSGASTREVAAGNGWRIYAGGADNPLSLFWFGTEATFAGSGGEVSYTWQVEVPAGGRATVIHFAAMEAPEAGAEYLRQLLDAQTWTRADSGDLPEAERPTLRLLGMLMDALPPTVPEAFPHLSEKDYASNVSFPAAPGRHVQGSAGTHAAFAKVVVTNTTQGSERTTYAKTDGSWSVWMPVVSGDVITAVGDDGNTLTLIEP